MRSLLFIPLILSLFLSCRNNNTKQTTDPGLIAKNTAVVKCNISGMTCTGCETTIKDAVSKLEGIKSVSASYIDSIAIVEFDSAVIGINTITQKITDLGYNVISVSDN